jgi:hypothetical protein
MKNKEIEVKKPTPTVPFTVRLDTENLFKLVKHQKDMKNFRVKAAKLLNNYIKKQL